jgi:hypothetical protein
MTDNTSEAEEMQELWLAFDCVAEVRTLQVCVPAFGAQEAPASTRLLRVALG